MVIVLTVGLPAVAQAAPVMDPDPADTFAHIAEQRDQLSSDLTDAGATITDNAAGGFEISVPPVPTRVTAGGASRPIAPTAVRFDAVAGTVTFTFAGIGDVRFIALDRTTPSAIVQGGNAVTAHDVDRDIDEYTVASHALLEQHLVVSWPHSQNKLIEYRYRVEAPARTVTSFDNGLLSITHGDDVLIAMRADYAMDEAGQRLPASLDYDEATGVATVTYDGRPLAPTGSVAIDPVFLTSNEVGIYVMKICQAPPGSVCDVQAVCSEVPTDPCHESNLSPGVGGRTFGNFRSVQRQPGESSRARSRARSPTGTGGVSSIDRQRTPRFVVHSSTAASMTRNMPSRAVSNCSRTAASTARLVIGSRCRQQRR